MLLRLILLLLAAVSGLTAARALGHALPDEGQIAFQTNRHGGDADIFLVDVRTRLMAHVSRVHEGNELGPSWAPDGKRLAFTGSHPSNGPEALYILDIGSDARRIHEAGGALQPTWSPDGTTLAFFLDGTLTLLELASGTLIQRPNPLPEWTPAGLRIRLTDTALINGAYSLRVGGSVYNTPLSSALNDPAWSPDRRRVAFAVWDGTQTALFWFDAACLRIGDCTGAARLIPGTETAREPTFSSDGERVAFICRREFRDEVCMVSLDGSGLEQLTWSPRGVYQRSPDWRP